ncbi:P-type DNA transfer protein VirB5 [Dongshaea marina]|uniref:P-type DNA transfer protein VirB5 n=1 Tax=Dongshaea marina TaxID=2047966 RepID=UPI000D3E09EF|nr:P-type DNA transfer protein VirB5 [Dongshaea marina]
MKKLTIAVSMIAASCMTYKVIAGIPVAVDVDIPGQIAQALNYTQYAQQTATLANQLTTLSDQLNKMRQQYDQMRRDYAAVTGTRNLGDIFYNPELNQYLPSNWASVYKNIMNNGYQGLSGAAKALRDSSKIFDVCQYYKDAAQKRSCEAASVQPAQNASYAQEAYAKSAKRETNINRLMRQINSTTDPKGIAELNGRIQSEQAMIQNTQTKLAMYQAASQAQQELVDQQQREAQAKVWNSTNYGGYVAPIR